MARKPGISGESQLELLSSKVPLIHKQAIREEAIKLSTPQKQVNVSDVVRSIVAEWYENRISRRSK